MLKHAARLLGFSLLAAVLAMVWPFSAFAAENAAASSGSSWASWYGAPFQGHRMANGQIYNMYNPATTASNWFPFNTWVRVTNPSNGRSVTVRVTDRGAFSYAFDLSYAAFAKIASPSSGKIRITYQVVSGPAVRPAARPVVPAPAKTVAKSTSQSKARPQLTSRGGARSSVEARPLNPDYRTYVVRSGDSLSSIARLFGVELGALIGANNLANPSLIHPQQKLAIPEANRVDVALYGDDLHSIATRNGVSVARLLAVNDFHAFAYPYPGKIVEIP